MAMNSVNNNYNNYVGSYDPLKSIAKSGGENGKEKEFWQSELVATEDVFVKSVEYKTDAEKVNTMKAELRNNVAAFKNMVRGLIQKQGNIAGQAGQAMDILMEIDEATQLKAQQAISEDGEWGVEQTAQRLLDFAKALTGGDPSKAGAMRDAFKAGFAAAEKVWGGKLPDISYQTYDRVMKGFDEWENPDIAEEAAKPAGA